MNTQVRTAEEARQVIERAAQENKPENRVTKTFQVGKVVQQGDIYLHMVKANHPLGPARRGEEARQLAQGDNVGALHIAEPPAVVYEGTTPPPGMTKGAPVFLGPCIKAPGRVRITHPKHGAHSLPAGTYQVTHQLDSRTMQRVRD